MRQNVQICLFMLMTVFALTACGNKPLQLELPDDTATTNTTSNTDN